jgi:hypothetical protein
MMLDKHFKATPPLGEAGLEEDEKDEEDEEDDD